MKVAQQLQYHIKVEQVKSYSTLYQTTSQVILFELNLLKSILQQLQHHYQMRTFNLLFLRGLIKLHLVQLRSRTYQQEEKWTLTEKLQHPIEALKMQKYKQRKKVSKNQKLEPLVRHLLPKNTQLWLWRVRLWGSRSSLWWLRICLGNDDEIFINNSSKPEFSPTCEDEGYAYLHSVWDELNPPIPEQNIIGKYFGLIYYTGESRKKGRLFVDKVIRRFCQDAKGPAQFLEFECLKKASGMPTVLEKTPSHFDQEIDLIPAWDIYVVQCQLLQKPTHQHQPFAGWRQGNISFQSILI